jgi:hypothetical protein
MSTVAAQARAGSGASAARPAAITTASASCGFAEASECRKTSPLPQRSSRTPLCPDGERERAAIVLLPSTPEQREQALLASERVTAALGDEVLGAFLAVRRSDAEWAADRTLEEVVTGHLWRY